MIKILSLHYAAASHRAARPRLWCTPDAPRPCIHLAVRLALAADGWAATAPILDIRQEEEIKEEAGGWLRRYEGG